jgi:hypothetical protein
MMVNSRLQAVWSGSSLRILMLLLLFPFYLLLDPLLQLGIT